MADLVGTVDQGPISTRFMLFDHGGNEVGRHQFEAEQIPYELAGLCTARSRSGSVPAR